MNDLPWLQALARRFPTRDAALAEMAHLESVLALPKGTVHIVSDVHGEDKKLSHIIRNASGGLRALVDELFAKRLGEGERRELLSLVYYVRETFMHHAVSQRSPEERARYLDTRLGWMLELIRRLGAGHTMRALQRVFPAPFHELFSELISPIERGEAYRRALLRPFVARGQELDVLRLASRIVRNLSVHELIVAGDLGDRGPRLDRVIEILKKQPNVSITWGNHDVVWMAACLGHDACIATVVRVSLRYRRLSQLEEGYGITMAPVEKLARDVYGDDPCDRFLTRGTGLRDDLLMARMQKAMAVLQFKLEAQAAARNPDFELSHRALLRHVDLAAGTVTIGDKTFPLRDKNLPTLDPKNPDQLTADEQRCIDRLRESFLASPRLWDHMQFVRGRGHMLLKRDHNLIFHGCLPVDDKGELLSFDVDGSRAPGAPSPASAASAANDASGATDASPAKGKALLAAFERVVHRAYREKRPRDLDLLWYLWTGARSPLFGKDRMATFEGYFVADEDARRENKNPYFKLVHDAAFCAKVFEELEADPRIGFIVNGHVPVKVEKGEEPLKKSGRAVTIDGAFSEAYGDRGYTLILDAQRTALAEHHHFESVAAAVASGADIVPKVTDLRRFDRPRTVGDTEKGEEIRREIDALTTLIRAYEDNILLET